MYCVSLVLAATCRGGLYAHVEHRPASLPNNLRGWIKLTPRRTVALTFLSEQGGGGERGGGGWEGWGGRFRHKHAHVTLYLGDIIQVDIYIPLHLRSHILIQ